MVRTRAATPRTVRVRHRFEFALQHLAKSRPADSITVAEICLRAGMGRHTFFQVFASLADAKAAALGLPHAFQQGANEEGVTTVEMRC